MTFDGGLSGWYGRWWIIVAAITFKGCISGAVGVGFEHRSRAVINICFVCSKLCPWLIKQRKDCLIYLIISLCEVIRP